MEAPARGIGEFCSIATISPIRLTSFA